MISEWTYVRPPQRHELFAEVRCRLVSATERQVVVVIQPDANLGFELGMTALALDGSRSMLRTYAAHLPKMIRRRQNKVHPIAQDLAAFLAKNSGDQCAIGYWACGHDGGDIEPLGLMNAPEIQAYEFSGPQQWGGGTKLTPIVQYFWEQIFAAADKPGMAVIVTDGAWDDDDHARLLQLTQTICDEVTAGRRQLMKGVVLGLKTDENRGEVDRINERFIALNEYDSGTEEDVWYTNWVNELEDWRSILDGILAVRGWSLGVGGFVEVDGQKVLQQDEFSFDIAFQLPASAQTFKLHLEGVGDYEQRIL